MFSKFKVVMIYDSVTWFMCILEKTHYELEGGVREVVKVCS